MSELNPDMIQRRYETVASGTYSPEIPGLPGLTFTKMSLKERGASSRAYSAKLKELMAEGGYFNEPFLPSILEKACRENGLDIGVMRKQRELVKKFYDSIPPEFNGPYDKLTPEEVALLPQEERDARELAIHEHTKQVMDFAQNFYTEDDNKIFAAARQIEQLEQHLRANTAEHRARMFQAMTEILLCARRSEKDDEAYFSSTDDIEELGVRNNQALVDLFTKWNQFKSGLLQDFFRANSAELQ